MNSNQLLEQLGLFQVAPDIKLRSQQERAEDNQLLNTFKDFFTGQDTSQGKDEDGDTYKDAKEEKKRKEQQKQAQRREKHLQMMDATKKMYIDQILDNKLLYSCHESLCRDFESLESVKEVDRQELERKQKEAEEKTQQRREATYLQKLQKVIEIFANPSDLLRDPSAISHLRIDRFPLLISNAEAILRNFHEQGRPILELTLTSTFLTASECLVIGENPQSRNLRSLNLSCNPIAAKGLLFLVHPSHSQLSEKLHTLTLFNCEIDHSQSYLISNDHLQNGKVKFRLRHLNLSHNKLAFFLNYLVEFDLINCDLQTLLLDSCLLTDEHLLNMATSQSTSAHDATEQVSKMQSLETLDISNNTMAGGFPLFVKQLRDSAEFLKNLICEGNSGIRASPSVQIAKSKKGSLAMLQRLDLTNSLRGDEQVAQLAQSSYLKDLKFLSLRKCKFGDDGFRELLCSKHLRYLEVLNVRDNKIKTVEGPFSDLDEATEKQIKKGIMKLQLLDIRGNKLTKIFLKEAVNFLKETVVLMWDNPFGGGDVPFGEPAKGQPHRLSKEEEEAREEISQEFYDPGHMFRSGELDDDYHLIQNVLHVFNQEAPQGANPRHFKGIYE